MSKKRKLKLSAPSIGAWSVGRKTGGFIDIKKESKGSLRKNTKAFKRLFGKDTENAE